MITTPHAIQLPEAGKNARRNDSQVAHIRLFLANVGDNLRFHA
jgi:hypothetical protein